MSAADSGFVNRNYSMTAISGVDELTVDKTRGSEWTTIEMTVNGDKNLVIVRSRYAGNVKTLLIRLVISS